MEFTVRQVAISLVISVLISLYALSHAASTGISDEDQKRYDDAVQFYRDGEYDKSGKVFKQIVKSNPEWVEAHYYYAISLAQLGRFKEARSEYEAVLRLAPDSEAAALAKQGVDYLPSSQQLDTPPQFQKPGKMTIDIPKASEVVQANLNPEGQQQNSKSNSPFGNMNPEALQMMMMMNAMGGGGSTGFNPMSLMLMQQMNPGKTGEEEGHAANPMNIPPDVMQTMMMNQMMQNFDMFGSGKDKD